MSGALFACPLHKHWELGNQVGGDICSYSGRGFENMAQVIRHLRDGHKRHVERCQRCSRFFFDERSLKEHPSDAIGCPRNGVHKGDGQTKLWFALYQEIYPSGQLPPSPFYPQDGSSGLPSGLMGMLPSDPLRETDNGHRYQVVDAGYRVSQHPGGSEDVANHLRFPGQQTQPARTLEDPMENPGWNSPFDTTFPQLTTGGAPHQVVLRTQVHHQPEGSYVNSSDVAAYWIPDSRMDIRMNQDNGDSLWSTPSYATEYFDQEATEWTRPAGVRIFPDVDYFQLPAGRATTQWEPAENPNTAGYHHPVVPLRRTPRRQNQNTHEIPF